MYNNNSKIKCLVSSELHSSSFCYKVLPEYLLLMHFPYVGILFILYLELIIMLISVRDNKKQMAVTPLPSPSETATLHACG